jgi:hypothetical protein
MRDSLTVIDENGKDSRYSTFAYLNVLKVMLANHESDPHEDQLRNNGKLSLGDRYGELSRKDIVKLLSEAVEHIKGQNELVHRFATSNDEQMPLLTFDEALHQNCFDANADDTYCWDNCFIDDESSLSNTFDDFDEGDTVRSQSCDATDREPIASDDANYEQLKSEFYADYSFWIKSTMELEVLHIERIRRVSILTDESLINERKKQKILKEHQQLFADIKIIQDREFIVGKFLVYFEIAKLLALPSTSCQQASRLIETIVKGKQDANQAVNIVRMVAQRFDLSYYKKI